MFVKFKGRGDVARAAAEVGDECRRDLGAYAPARKLYEKLLAEYPDSTQGMRATRGIVNIDIKRGNYAAAEAGVQTLLTKYANHADLPMAFYYLGNDYLDARLNAEAADCYQYTIDNRPDSTEGILSRSGMAQVHIYNGDEQAAQDVVEMMVADFNDHPDLPLALWRTANAYYYNGSRLQTEGHNEEGDAQVKMVVTLGRRLREKLPATKDTVEAWFYSGIASSHVKEYSEAIEFYRELVKRWPASKWAPTAQWRIGTAYQFLAARREISRAAGRLAIREAFEKMVEDYPDHVLAKDARSWLKNKGFYSKEGEGR